MTRVPMKPFGAILAVMVALPAMADPSLKPEIAPLGFLVGHWMSDDGEVADTGGTSRGISDITVEADGAALLRRDRTEIVGKDGKPAGGFSQLMMIYSEAGSIQATYEDGEGHLIHYSVIKTVPERSAVFTSAPQPGAPTFQLTYELKAADTLTVSFGLIPPGQTSFQPIATGTLRRKS